MTEQQPTPAASAAAPAPQQEDISSKTIVVLVILALVVSFIGAWVNIQQAMHLGDAPAQEKQSNVASAQIGFVVTPRAPAPEPMSTTATGKVTLAISDAT